MTRRMLVACVVGCASLGFAWANSPPVLSPIVGPSALKKGVSYGWSGSWTDADAGDVHTVQWRFGDESPFAPPPFVPATSPATMTHTYNRTGVFQIRFTVRDSGSPTGAAFATKTVTVTN